MKSIKNIDAYIPAAPKDAQAKLKKFRATVIKHPNFQVGMF